MTEEENLLFMIGYAISREKSDLRKVAEKHTQDEKAKERVATAVLKHLRMCGYDVVRVKPPAKAH